MFKLTMQKWLIIEEKFIENLNKINKIFKGKLGQPLGNDRKPLISGSFWR